MLRLHHPLCRYSSRVGSSLHLAAAALYEHRLDNLGAAFARAGLCPVIVKGQAIVDLAYPADEPRLAGDVDLLVGEDEEAVCQALREAGYREQSVAGRKTSSALLGERPFAHRGRNLPGLVEVHRFFDKGILRPVDYTGIMQRARMSRRAGFRYPTPEDLLLLVVLHESVAKAPSLERTRRDVDMILRHARPDMTVVEARAAVWQLRKALALVLAGQSLGSAAEASGMAYLWAQRRHHDRVLTWAAGLAQYAWARVLDRR